MRSIPAHRPRRRRRQHCPASCTRQARAGRRRPRQPTWSRFCKPVSIKMFEIKLQECKKMVKRK
jgi:hypothetical protein